MYRRLYTYGYESGLGSPEVSLSRSELIYLALCKETSAYRVGVAATI